MEKSMESPSWRNSLVRAMSAEPSSTLHVLLGPVTDSEKPRNKNTIDLSRSTRMCCCSSSASSSLGPRLFYCDASEYLYEEPSKELGAAEFLRLDDGDEHDTARTNRPENEVDLLGWMRKTIVHRPDLEAIRNLLLLDDADECHQATTTTTNAPKRVRFEHVNVRYYSQVLGNNPACRDGAPIELSWDHFDEHKLSVDEFDRTHRRHRKDFKLTALQRSYRLSALGYSRQQIMEAQKRVQMVQCQRQATRAKLRSFLGRWHDRLQERTEAFYSSSSSSVREHKTRRRLPPPQRLVGNSPTKSSC